MLVLINEAGGRGTPIDFIQYFQLVPVGVVNFLHLKSCSISVTGAGNVGIICRKMEKDPPENQHLGKSKMKWLNDKIIKETTLEIFVQYVLIHNSHLFTILPGLVAFIRAARTPTYRLCPALPADPEVQGHLFVDPSNWNPYWYMNIIWDAPTSQ